MIDDGRKRVVIESVQPEVDDGRFAIKRAVGEKVVVSADLFTDGHDSIAARVLYRKAYETQWKEAPMEPDENDRWNGEFLVTEVGVYCYTVEGWVDPFRTWQKDFSKKYQARQDVGVDLLIGAQYIEEAIERASGESRKKLSEWVAFIRGEGELQESVAIVLGENLGRLMDQHPNRDRSTRYGKELTLVVDRKRALFSTWYERFPRSCSSEAGTHGTLRDCERILPEIAKMGFDIFYLPPIHPIGKTNRKGRNNSPLGSSEDPGSPWAVGCEDGGHKSIHPLLGTLDDFERLQEKAERHGIEIAMDLAFQCAPDHPYVKESPQWFKRRPDGTIQYAENPPKKYEDIFPLNFETDEWRELWEELRAVVLFWVGKGVRIFRVDNPHTKPFAFWEWLIGDVKKDYPEVIFLAEAFTRPKVMYRLAKVGFTQSYTYFTWRNSKRELTEYLAELTKTERREYFRPCFWPNTPDILPEFLQYGGRPAFVIRLILAATLSSNYGIYGPEFELIVSEAIPGREEYLDSEKYEIKHRNWDEPGNLKEFIARVNRIRRQNSAFQTTWNLEFYDIDNDYLLAYGKVSDDFSETILVVVNLDPFHVQSGWLRVPIRELGINPDQPYLCHDLLSDDKYIWQGERNYVQLNPHVIPANIFKLKRRMRRETDFDYFM